MKPTEQLKEEHNAIKLMLKILYRISEKLEKGEDISAEQLEKILEFIRVFADKCHHGKEEDLLFPAMEECGVPKEGGPIGVMLTEHNEGRNYVKNFADGISEYKANKSKGKQKIIVNARNYINLLTQHIEKEDNILYQIADMHIPEEKQEELLEQFEKVEKEIIGEGKHEEFHKLLHSLEKIYLK